MYSYRLAALLLAHVGARAHAEGTPKSDLCALRTALGCEGGGYRAMAGCTGLTAGFLAALGGDDSGDGDSPTGQGLGLLFEEVDLFAANSGGSWYAVSTLYSAEVPEMMEQMAAAPSEAGDTYNRLWTDQTLAVTRRLGEVSQSIVDEVDASYCPAILAAYAGVSFTDVIFDDFIGGPTSIPDTATLSMKPNSSWAEGKVLLLCSSLPTPGTAGDDGRVWLHFSQDAAGEVNGSVSYRARSSRGAAAPFPMWTPVKFGFRLGDGEDAAAPFPFCATEDCNGLFLEYMGYSEESGENYTALSPGLGQIFNPFLVEGAGSLPIADVVAASNSVAGSAIISDPAEDGGAFPEDPYSSADCVDLAHLVDSDSWGNPFSSEDSDINEELIQDTAASGLQGLVDGAWTDNTGVANSMGVLTSATGCAGPPRKLSITVMLTGEDVSEYFLALFPGANISLGPVCSSPTYLEVQEQMEASAAMLPHFNASYLTSINYGTVKCETAENIWYGVRAGHEVDIHFLWIVTALGTSPPSDDFYAQGTMAGEIVETMAHERETVRRLAGEMLLLSTESPGTSSAPRNATLSAGSEELSSTAASTFPPAFPLLSLALALLLRSF